MDEVEIAIGRRRGQTWRQVGYGVYRRRTVESGDPVDGPASAGSVDPAEEHARRTRQRLADLHAWQGILPTSGSFTHLTAAEAHGLWLPPIPDALPAMVALPKSDARPKRRELRVLRSAPFEAVTVDGLRLALVPETLLACARDLGLLDLAVLIDSARRRGDCSSADVAAFAGSKRWGAPALQRALEFSDPRAESPWESLLRMFHVLCEVPVEPQFEVFDEQGVFVARGDLWLRGTRTLHEYDGAVHRDRRTHVRDLARERRLANSGWVRRGYAAGDLLGRAQVILREADAALGRPHDPRRLDPWLDALRDSLFTSSGRTRLLRRLGR